MSRPNRKRTIEGESNLAERVAQEREAAGLSYEKLAEKMTEAGCAIQGSALYKIEKGNPRRRVTVDELLAFSEVFDIPVDDLLTPVPLLKQRWAEKWLKEADTAERELALVCDRLANLWLDYYRAGLADALDDVDEDEAAVTYLSNLASSLPTRPHSKLGGLVDTFATAIRDLAEGVVKVELGLPVEGDEGATDGKH